MSDNLDLPEDTLAQVDEYLGHVDDGRWVCVWRDAHGIEYDASEDMRTLHACVHELQAQAARDAKVMRLVAEYVALNDEMDDLNEADIDYIEKFDELWLKADKAWDNLRAALDAAAWTDSGCVSLSRP